MENLIEKLKHNEKPFGRLSPEEQECRRKVGTENCESYFMQKYAIGWKQTYAFCGEYAIRSQSDYQPKPEKPEYVDIKITREHDTTGWLGIRFAETIPNIKYDFLPLHCIPSLSNFEMFYFLDSDDEESEEFLDSISRLIDSGKKVFARFRK